MSFINKKSVFLGSMVSLSGTAFAHHETEPHGTLTFYELASLMVTPLLLFMIVGGIVFGIWAFKSQRGHKLF